MLDAQLLAEVYLAMTRGQESLTIEIASPTFMSGGTYAIGTLAPILVLVPTAEELAAHHAYLQELERESRGGCVWLALAA